MKGIYLTGVTAVAAFALPALVAVLSYLLGCINGAIATSHIFYHDDVRRHGSGNAGLTNFYRNYGAKCAPMVIAFDMIKAVGAVLLGNYFLGYLLGWGAAGKYFGALFCVIGHMFPVFYGFKGGKGILCSGTLLLASRLAHRARRLGRVRRAVAHDALCVARLGRRGGQPAVYHVFRVP